MPIRHDSTRGGVHAREKNPGSIPKDRPLDAGGGSSPCDLHKAEIDDLRRENERLQQTIEAVASGSNAFEIEDLRSELSSLNRKIEDLQREIARLNRKNAELRQQLEQVERRKPANSRNSSKPPSSDEPSTPKRKPGKKPSGRKPGGQPGHERNTRPLIPSEEADRIEPHYPAECGGCGKKIDEEERRKDPNLADEHRHQQVDIPPMKPLVTENQCQTAECGVCHTVTRATLPESVSRSSFGPNVMALIVLLTGSYRVSKRGVQSLLAAAFGLKISLGAISKIEQRMTAAMRTPVGILGILIEKAAQVAIDETSWKEKAKRVWLWIAVTSFGAIYRIRPSRAAQIAKEILGTGRKLVTSDRYSGYAWIPVYWCQKCWAHLKRDFTWIMEQGGRAGEIGKELLKLEKELFVLWHRFKAGKLKRSSLRTLVSGIRIQIRQLLEEAVCLDQKKVSGMCRKILEVEPALYTFVRREGVEPTNNGPELLVRHPAILRRISFGTWSRSGSDFIECILSTLTTLRIQGRDEMSYLREAAHAALAGQDAPQLVPIEDVLPHLAA